MWDLFVTLAEKGASLLEIEVKGACEPLLETDGVGDNPIAEQGGGTWSFNDFAAVWCLLEDERYIQWSGDLGADDDPKKKVINTEFLWGGGLGRPPPPPPPPKLFAFETL